nr:MAG TPA: hypothetical protein [Caudoviricetes sp.]
MQTSPECPYHGHSAEACSSEYKDVQVLQSLLLKAVHQR